MAVIDAGVLRHLDSLVTADERDLFACSPGGAGRFTRRALCQGAALHLSITATVSRTSMSGGLYGTQLRSIPVPLGRQRRLQSLQLGRWSGDDPGLVRQSTRRRDRPFTGCSARCRSRRDASAYLSLRATASARAFASKAVHRCLASMGRSARAAHGCDGCWPSPAESLSMK